MSRFPFPVANVNVFSTRQINISYPIYFPLKYDVSGVIFFTYMSHAL